MDSNIKATAIACLFTLILSTGGVYGALKVDDAELRATIESMEDARLRQAFFMDKTIDNQNRSIRLFQEQMEKMTLKYMDRTDILMGKIEVLSNLIARLDERLKPIEARRN